MEEPSKSDPPPPESGRKRKRCGRAQRRRKAKLREIETAEARLFSDDGVATTTVADATTTTTTTTSIPTDRDKIWPGVLEKRGNDGGLSSADEAFLTSQLGYIPGNCTEVSARANQVPSLPLDANVPIVLKLYPLAIREAYAGGKQNGRKFKSRRRGKNGGTAANAEDDNTATNPKQKEEELPLLEPFPTMYWLTHPILRTLTSKLELTDHIRMLEERLQSDPTALTSMQRAHELYGQERWESLTRSDFDLVKKRKWEPALDSRRGVAGICKHYKIKCLHAHLAHYLSGEKGSTDNVVGKWVLESITTMLQEKNGGEKQTETASKSSS